MREGAGCGGRQTLSAVAILLPTSVARRRLSAPHDRRHHCHHLSAPPLRSMRISYIDSPTGSRSLDRRARSSGSPLISFLSSEIAIAPTEKHRRSKRSRRRRRRRRLRRQNTHFTQPSSRLIMFKAGGRGRACSFHRIDDRASLEGGRGRGEGCCAPV